MRSVFTIFISRKGIVGINLHPPVLAVFFFIESLLWFLFCVLLLLLIYLKAIYYIFVSKELQIWLSFHSIMPFSVCFFSFVLFKVRDTFVLFVLFPLLFLHSFLAFFCLRNGRPLLRCQFGGGQTVTVVILASVQCLPMLLFLWDRCNRSCGRVSYYL